MGNIVAWLGPDNPGKAGSSMLKNVIRATASTTKAAKPTKIRDLVLVIGAITQVDLIQAMDRNACKGRPVAPL